MKEEREFRYSDFFWNAVYNWKLIVIVAFIFACLLGGYKFITQYREYTDEGLIAKRQEEYEESLKTYNDKKSSLENTIESLSKSVDNAKTYMEKSELLRIDPYNVYVTVLTYYIDTGYQINPSLSYQDINYTSIVVNIYKNAIDDLDLDVINIPDLGDIMTWNPVTNNNLSVITSSISQNSILTIKIIGENGFVIKAIEEKVYDSILQTEKVLNEFVDEHSVSLLSREEKQTINSALLNMQDSFNSEYSTNLKLLEDKKEELANLEEPVDNTPTIKALVIAVIKYSIFGLIIGFFLSFVAISLKIVIGNKIFNIREVTTISSVLLLGVLVYNKPQSSSLQRAKKHLGIKLGTREESLKYIAQVIEMNELNRSVLVLTGDCTQKALEDIKEGINNINLLIQLETSSMPFDHNTLKQVNNQNVILVERWNRTSYDDVEDQKEASSISNSSIVGMIVIE